MSPIRGRRCHCPVCEDGTKMDRREVNGGVVHTCPACDYSFIRFDDGREEEYVPGLKYMVELTPAFQGFNLRYIHRRCGGSLHAFPGGQGHRLCNKCQVKVLVQNSHTPEELLAEFKEAVPDELRGVGQ